MNQDEDLKDFFSGLRAEDERMAPPPFPDLPLQETKIRRLPMRRLAMIASAAVALLLLFTWWPKVPEDVAEGEVLVISFEAEVPTQTKTLLDEQESMYSWVSPSASLIADF